MPYLNNEIEIYINENYGDPTLTILGSYGTIDGFTIFTQTDFRGINFIPDTETGIIDGFTTFDETDFRGVS